MIHTMTGPYTKCTLTIDHPIPTKFTQILTGDSITDTALTRTKWPRRKYTELRNTVPWVGSLCQQATTGMCKDMMVTHILERTGVPTVPDKIIVWKLRSNIIHSRGMMSSQPIGIRDILHPMVGIMSIVKSQSGPLKIEGCLTILLIQGVDSNHPFSRNMAPTEWSFIHRFCGLMLLPKK